jgi:hypothetical protein
VAGGFSTSDDVAMSATPIADIIRSLQRTEARVAGDHDLVPPMILKNEVKAPVGWDASAIESALPVKLPDDIKALWNTAAEVRLLSDVNYSQWGCILWSPSEIVRRHEKALGWRGTENFRPGDLVIGEFQGDADLVVLRCDPHGADFGRIVVALGTDPRESWPSVADSIGDFIVKFVASPDIKFWDVR